MANKRSTRFLIDKIDAQLGSVEKELKFDASVIAVGLVLAIVGIAFISIDNFVHPGLNALCLIMIMVGLCFAYVMSKEYISDLKRAKAEGKR